MPTDPLQAYGGDDFAVGSHFARWDVFRLHVNDSPGKWKVPVLERRKYFADLYLCGRSQWQIAQELDVNRATVSRDLEALRVE